MTTRLDLGRVIASTAVAPTAIFMDWQVTGLGPSYLMREYREDGTYIADRAGSSTSLSPTYDSLLAGNSANVLQSCVCHGHGDSGIGVEPLALQVTNTNNGRIAMTIWDPENAVIVGISNARNQRFQYHGPVWTGTQLVWATTTSVDGSSSNPTVTIRLYRSSTSDIDPSTGGTEIGSRVLAPGYDGSAELFETDNGGHLLLGGDGSFAVVVGGEQQDSGGSPVGPSSGRIDRVVLFNSSGTFVSETTLDSALPTLTNGGWFFPLSGESGAFCFGVNGAQSQLNRFEQDDGATTGAQWPTTGDFVADDAFVMAALSPDRDAALLWDRDEVSPTNQSRVIADVRAASGSPEIDVTLQHPSGSSGHSVFFRNQPAAL